MIDVYKRQAMDIEKYRGVIPAFYACYDEAGQVSGERTRALARHLVNKGVKGLYAVSYTHLDVYKRQMQCASMKARQLFASSSQSCLTPYTPQR